MPKTKRKPQPIPAVLGNDPMPQVLTLSEAAAYLRLSEPEVVRLVHEQGLPGRQAGAEWRFLLTAIRDWLSRGSEKLSNKDAWMRLVGVWKDDPTLDELRKEIQRQQQLMSEDEK